MGHCNRCDPPGPTAHDPYGNRSVGCCDSCAARAEQEQREWEREMEAANDE